MQNPIYLHDPAHQSTLRRHFGAPETTIVLSEVPVGWDIRQRRGLRVPDLLIAFEVDRRRIISDRGYSIEELGKPPDFVLEVASESTGQRDIREKRNDYAAFGIPEYWRFDPSGGLYHGAPLAGDRLVSGVYQPIAIVHLEQEHYHGYSDVLRLDLCWHGSGLRWYDSTDGRYLRTLDEEAEERMAAEGERDAAQHERETERQGRLAAQTEREAERQARLAAEERVRELEAEIRRLHRVT